MGKIFELRQALRTRAKDFAMCTISNSISRFGLLVILLILPLAGFADIAQDLKWGNQMLQQKKYDEAAHYFNGAIKEDPNNATAYKGLGYAFVGKRDKAKALPYLKYSLHLNPGDTQLQGYVASLGGGASQAQAGAPSAASEAAYKNGVRYMQARQYQYAAYYFDQSSKADANSAKAWQGLGTAFYSQGARDKAISAWDRAVALDPSNLQLAQYVATQKASSPQAAPAAAPVAVAAAPAPQPKQAFNPWIMGTTVAALGAIMLFLF